MSGDFKTSLAGMRKDYELGTLRKWDLAENPLEQFERWFKEAVQSGLPEPSAMTLSTVSPEGQPSSRIVLLKGVDERGFLFFTNYLSAKGAELASNPRAAVNFHWKELERQVCALGRVTRLDRAESEAYFNSRPFKSRCGAWVSQQSSVVEGREVLEQKMALLLARHGADEKVPIPPYWGGYCLAPHSIEFWQGQRSRLHDRLRYLLQEDGKWKLDRLSP